MLKKAKARRPKSLFLTSLTIFVLLGILAYFFREAIFWTTYRNEELGFSFRYPASWTIQVIDENPNDLNDATAIVCPSKTCSVHDPTHPLNRIAVIVSFVSDPDFPNRFFKSVNRNYPEAEVIESDGMTTFIADENNLIRRIQFMQGINGSFELEGFVLKRLIWPIDEYFEGILLEIMGSFSIGEYK